ncbi:hypothetical protein AB0M50_55910, partial [Nonomuraea fuscirosea]|uniref:hypothetical protein n=1 Tax=Nonomuraea fuscirosea TaxID=1291556 RepID=UPI00343FD81F
MPSKALGRTARRGLATAAVLGLMLTTGANPAFAHWNGTGQDIASIHLRPYSYNSAWQTPMNKALSNWNATSSPANFYKNSNSGSTITAKSYSNTWYGLYQRCGGMCSLDHAIRRRPSTRSSAGTRWRSGPRRVSVRP